MEFTNELFTFFIPAWLLIAAGFILSLVITYTAIPTIVSVAKARGLNGKSTDRSSHHGDVPLLGGVAVFAGLILSTVVIAGVGFVHELKFIIAGLIVMFFIGVKDDILIIDPRKKLVAQIMASLIIIVLGNIRIDTFHGVLGIDHINYFSSVLFTTFLFIVIINGYNLIDGIDGLSAGVGIVTSLAFGIWFWLAGVIPYTVMSFSLAGALAGFFPFNVFGKKNKIFLGDTGSLVVGLTMAIVLVKFLQTESSITGITSLNAAPAVAVGIMIVPLFDTFRVFVLRIAYGKSPFKADRNHVHHRLLDLGKTHLRATGIIILVNLIFIALVYILDGVWGNYSIFALELVLATLLSYIPVYLVNRRKRKSSQASV